MHPSRSSLMRIARPLAIQASRRVALGPSSSQLMPQDLPPEGGYEPVQYKRSLPARGFRPIYYVIAGALFMTYGWWKLAVGIEEWNELGREKMWARIHLIPLLQAEEDRDQVRRYFANEEREMDLLGKKSKIYHSERFVRPAYSTNPGVTKE